MDIGAPPSLEESVPQAGSQHLHGLGSHNGHTHLLELPPLSASFPLPFRVLTLVGLAIFLWATNLHILHLLGINVPKALDFRDTQEDDDDVDVFPSTGEKEEVGDLKTTYMTIYKLGLIYAGFVGFGWVLFRVITGGEVEVMEQWRGLVGVVLVGVGVGALAPWRGIGERERKGFRRYVHLSTVPSGMFTIKPQRRLMNRALKRILLPSVSSPIFFCDVILADILTSFAKVLGDLWVSGCQIWFGGITHGRVSQSGWSRWVTLGMVWYVPFKSHTSHYTFIILFA